MRWPALLCQTSESFHLLLQLSANGHLEEAFNRMRTDFLVLLFFAVLATSQAFNAKTIMRLVATVDPQTCNCVENNMCIIEIPYSTYIGINCGNVLKVMFFYVRLSSKVFSQSNGKISYKSKRFLTRIIFIGGKKRAKTLDRIRNAKKLLLKNRLWKPERHLPNSYSRG